MRGTRAGNEPAGFGFDAARPYATAVARNLLFLHLVLLVLIRVLCDADDFVNWDLTGFLNANSFGTLRELLARPEVHFRNPFSFPLYNVGAESVISAILFRILRHVSLYWTNVVVLLIYDALFLLLLHLLFKMLYGSTPGQSLAWLLLAMSPVVLTFMSTSAFNMQAYNVIVMGLVGSEYVLQRRLIVGIILLGTAFCMISQAYPLAFYLPYFVVMWSAFRTIGQPPVGASSRQRALLAAVHLVVVIGFVILVNWASGGLYFVKIAPENPYGASSSEPASVRLATAWFFLQQSFLPVQRVDGVPVGFAPYFVYVVLIGVSVSALVARMRRRGSPGPSGGLISAGLSVALVVFGYVPAFIIVIVKSQRSLFGDLFLVIVVVFWLLRLVESGWIGRAALWSLLAVLLSASDAYYLHFTLSVDHSRNHSPRFDFDLSDGIARHDLVAAIGAMKREVEQENAALVIYYPREYSENTTDPAMFFAQFLRHFGPYKNRPELIFPCRWCDVRYGCPFPEVLNRACGRKCCWTDPFAEIARREGLSGRKLVLWWHETPKDLDSVTVPGVTLESTLQRFGERYRVVSATVPPVAMDWRAFDLLALPDGERAPGKAPPASQSAAP